MTRRTPLWSNRARGDFSPLNYWLTAAGLGVLGVIWLTQGGYWGIGLLAFAVVLFWLGVRSARKGPR